MAPLKEFFSAAGPAALSATGAIFFNTLKRIFVWKEADQVNIQM